MHTTQYAFQTQTYEFHCVNNTNIWLRCNSTYDSIVAVHFQNTFPIISCETSHNFIQPKGEIGNTNQEFLNSEMGQPFVNIDLRILS